MCGVGREGVTISRQVDLRELIRWFREVKQLTQGHTAGGSFDFNSV